MTHRLEVASVGLDSAISSKRLGYDQNGIGVAAYWVWELTHGLVTLLVQEWASV